MSRFIDFSEGKALMVNNADWLLDLNYLQVLREVGAEVLGIASIFTYGLQKGVERLAAADVVNYSLSDFDTLSKVAAAEGYIADKDIAKLTAFQKNPQDPAWMEL